jgi:hypothetical protein
MNIYQSFLSCIEPIFGHIAEELKASYSCDDKKNLLVNFQAEKIFKALKLVSKDCYRMCQNNPIEKQRFSIYQRAAFPYYMEGTSKIISTMLYLCSKQHIIPELKIISSQRPEELLKGCMVNQFPCVYNELAYAINCFLGGHRSKLTAILSSVKDRGVINNLFETARIMIATKRSNRNLVEKDRRRVDELEKVINGYKLYNQLRLQVESLKSGQMDQESELRALLPPELIDEVIKKMIDHTYSQRA